MDREIAERLIAAALALDPGFGEIDAVISDIADEDLRHALVMRLGDIIGDVYQAFIVPVSREYPDLAEEE